MTTNSVPTPLKHCSQQSWSLLKVLSMSLILYDDGDDDGDIDGDGDENDKSNIFFTELYT